MRLSKLLQLVMILVILTQVIALQPVNVKAQGGSFKVLLVT